MLTTSLQSSYYDNAGGVTVAKPVTPILSTIGDEQGGRAPIVIQDHNVQVAAPEIAATIADPGKAEPGRDIFAGEPLKDIKSDNLPVQPPEPIQEHKEISSVIVGTLSSTTDSSKSTDESSSAASETPSTAQSDTTTTTEGAAAKPQTAGPLGEAELEAQKVANELYPNAAKK